jgi:hypothetical protein
MGRVERESGRRKEKGVVWCGGGTGVVAVAVAVAVVGLGRAVVVDRRTENRLEWPEKVREKEEEKNERSSERDKDGIGASCRYFWHEPFGV